jgi:hypothetical protein
MPACRRPGELDGTLQMRRFRACIRWWGTGWIGVLHKGSAELSCQITAFTAGLPVSRWHRPAPFTLGLITAVTLRSSNCRTLSICPSMPRPRNSMCCTSSNSNDHRSSKGLQGLLQSSRLHAACLPDHPQHTQRGAVWTRPSLPPTTPSSNDHLWCGRSSASHCASRPHGST